MLTRLKKPRAEEIRLSRRFQVEDIPLLTSVFERNLSMATPEWSDFAGTTLDLPDWFDLGLDPDSPEYKAQQLKLWQTISGRDRPYEPELDEKAAIGSDVDAVRFPSYYLNRAPNAVDHASDHMLAMALILKHSKARPGQWALEYGAGFGQTALALSRLGVNVDTVDISRQYCKYVQDAADFFGTKLTAFPGLFGENPRPGKKYDLIFFYEAFHHALNFDEVIGKLQEHLAPGGRVLLCGEPILANTCPPIPYPWGMRLDAETVVVTRSRGWLELGFIHEYILDVFTRHEFVGEHHPCELTPLGNLYSFVSVRPAAPASVFPPSHFPGMNTQPTAASTWHGEEANGRWTRARSVVRVELDPQKKHIRLDVINSLSVPKTLTIKNAGEIHSFDFKAGEDRTISIPNAGDAKLVLLTETHCPHDLDGSIDRRQLGVFVTAVYCS
jgi:SAM-dependent methyltransferase